MTALLRTGSPQEVTAMEAAARIVCGRSVDLVDRGHLRTCTGDVLIPWMRQPHALAPLGAILTARRAGCTVRWIDFDGSTGACSVGFVLFHALRFALFTLLDGVTRIGARAAAVLPPAAPVDAAGDGRLQVVLPVAPDLSHTFVYREALRVVAKDADARLVVLEQGLPDAPSHPEARAVAETGTFVPQRGVLARYLGIWRWILTHPRRVSALVRTYVRHSRGVGSLFGKLPLRDPRHPGNAFGLASLLAAEPHGPIHVYGSTYPANVVLGAACLTARPYSITSFVDFDADYDHRMLTAKYETSAFFRVCTAFCGRRMQELVEGAVPERLPVILFGLDLTEWADHARPAGRGVLFSASRLVPKKGLHLLPPAIAALRARGVECSWRVAGDGPELPRLREACVEHGVADRVEFLGSLTTEQVRAELAVADLATMPCLVAEDGERDGIPIFFTEAMALGVPVLTTPVSGIPELIADGDTGFLVEPENVAALAERLAIVLSDDELRAKVAARGREIVHRRLDVDDAAAELLQRLRSS